MRTSMNQPLLRRDLRVEAAQQAALELRETLFLMVRSGQVSVGGLTTAYIHGEDLMERARRALEKAGFPWDMPITEVRLPEDAGPPLTRNEGGAFEKVIARAGHSGPAARMARKR